MKKFLSILLFAVIMMGIPPLIGQQVNGERFTFKKGKAEWSDTVYKKLLTKQMAKEGKKGVLLGIRYKVDKTVEEGTWYQIEITNKSKDQDVKFNVASKHSQETFTVKLHPQQSKVFKKLYYKPKNVGIDQSSDADADFYISPYEEILQNRD